MEGEVLCCFLFFFFFFLKNQDDKVEMGRDADQALQETQYTIFFPPPKQSLDNIEVCGFHNIKSKKKKRYEMR